MSSQTVVIIGGGATGTGIARMAAEAGYHVVLVEQGAMASGTTGHFHGMLHSGARYAVNDPEVAAACYAENQLLRQIIPEAIRDTGGLFVALNEQEAAHADTLIAACKKAGIPITEISTQQALEREPALNPAITRALLVPDGSIDGAKLVALNRQAAEQAKTPARFLTNRLLTDFEFGDGDQIVAIKVRHAQTNALERIACDFVINATGVWAGRVTALADIELDMVYDKGTMITFKDTFNTMVLNRCRPEADGDLLVPLDGHSIMGTTARVIDNPDDCLPTQEEADVLLAEGIALIPALADAEALRIYAGVRPLIRSNSDQTLEPGQESRAISRGFKLIHHRDQGVPNFMTITGGKVTLYRLMAASVLDELQAYYAN